MKIHTLTIVGVGLIGGSVGLAAKRRGVAQRVLGVGRQRASLERARQLGAIDEGLVDLQSAAARAQLIVLCTPVDGIVEHALAAASYCSPGTLLTDAGSTKVEIVRRLEQSLPDGIAYVGSHPLAGSEKRGAEFADAELFQDRLTVVTQTPATDADALNKVCDFWKALGSRVRVMSPEDHDQAVAYTSHLPHVLAAALVETLPTEHHELTATGFRDTTRVAAGDPAIWKGILLQNRSALLGALELFTQRLRDFRTAIAANDVEAIDTLLTHAKKVRDALGTGTPPDRA
jgi:cyclohexadieny/prephenate dehydrogenase